MLRQRIDTAVIQVTMDCVGCDENCMDAFIGKDHELFKLMFFKGIQKIIDSMWGDYDSIFSLCALALLTRKDHGT